MREYVIFTDSTADLPPAIAEAMEIQVIPMEFKIGISEYNHYVDSRELGQTEFYERLRNGEMATTSQINIHQFKSCFAPVLKAGKDILYIAFSSGLSGTYGASCLAARELCREFPEAKLLPVDSLAASMGEGLLVYTAAKKKREGMDLEALAGWVVGNRNHLCHWFTVDDLGFLRRGGRVSAVSAALGSVLRIKPVLHVNDAGHLIPMEKARGRKRALQALVNRMERTVVEPGRQVIFIGHGDCPESAAYVEQLARDRFAVRDIVTGYIGPVIGSHSGPGTVALFFFGAHK